MPGAFPNEQRFARAARRFLTNSRCTEPPSRVARVRFIGEAEVPTQRFAVEFEHRTVGIAVRVPGGFMFFASTDEFEQIDGRLFRRARALERELKKVARGRSGAARTRPGVRQLLTQGAI